MRKYVFLALLLAAFQSATAQEVTAPEPEFINSYCILTSDSTYASLPKESGSIGKHQNKVKKWSKLIGGAANIAGAAGIVGIGTAGSMSGVVTGAKVVSTASSVGTAASTVNGLAGSEGMDIIFKSSFFVSLSKPFT